MIDKSSYDCCGCSACYAICPKEAISMQYDNLGFLYPVVNHEKCIDCGKCNKVCAFNSQYDRTNLFEKPVAYAVRHKDLNEVMNSRSGAFFVAISDEVLRQGGVVYGAGYDQNKKVIHKRATTRRERDEFRKSKYVQSEMGTIFNNVKTDLEKGLLVLFSGTPCQTAGLASFIGKSKRHNLLLVDIVCHGVPSPFIWKDYMLYQERRHHNKIVSFDFRDKELGWKAHKESFTFNNGKKIFDNLFKFLFIKNFILRNSCSRCHYSNIHRPSDITIGDFWGWEKIVPDFNKDNKGVSLVLCNTEKGATYFESLSKAIDCVRVPIEDCLQPNLIHPAKPHPKREQLEIEYSKYGFDYIAKKYGNNSIRFKCKKIILKIFRLTKIY